VNENFNLKESTPVVNGFGSAETSSIWGVSG